MKVIDGKYEVLKVLGEGFGGCVYLAESNGKKVALKQLEMDREGLSTEEVLESFKIEFSILTKLTHPHIVQILDFGFDDKKNIYYFTTEYIDGPPIFNATRNSTPQEIEEFFVQALRALSYLHNQKVFHLDIKSQNILIGENSEGQRAVKLIDFGLSGFRKTGFLAGTPSYLPPEALLGQPLDGRSDLYSLGVTWYECLTGKNPFEAEDLQSILDRQRSWAPPPVSTQSSAVPSYLDPILEKLLRKNPADRYHRADQVIRDLNWGGAKHYPLETDATALAYLPGEGQLVGRKEEVDQMTSYVERVFVNHTDLKSGVVISGPPGTGKTRLLKELKYHAQLRTIPVLEGRSSLQNVIDRDCILIIDDSDGSCLDLAERFLSLFHRHSILIVLATSSPKKVSGLWHNISLKNFNRPEVALYIASVLGMSDPPDYLVDELFRRTGGNPLFLTELMHSLIHSQQLFDEHGRWSPTRLEDIGIDFGKLKVPKNLTEFCENKYHQLSSTAQELLLTIALAKAPINRQDLIKMGYSDKLPDLKTLQEKDLLVLEPSGDFRLVNPSFKDWVPPNISPEVLSNIHESLGSLFQNDSRREFIAYYHLGLGHGNYGKRFQFLLQYGDFLYQKNQWCDAVKGFETALELAPNANDQVEARLRMVRSLFRAGQHGAALKVLEEAHKVLKKERENPQRWRWVQQTLREMGSIYIKEGRLDLAHESLEASRVLLEEHEENPIEEMILANLKASLLMREGKISEAATLSETNYQSWENWPLENKRQVLNNELANIYLNQGKINEAKEFLASQVNFFREIDNSQKQASALYGLALCFYLLKQYEEAIRNYQSCLELSRTLKNEELLFHTFNELGNIALFQKDWDHAASYYQRALELAQHLSDVDNSIGITINLAIILRAQGDNRGAGLYLRSVVSTLEPRPSHSLVQLQFLEKAYLTLGSVYLEDLQWTEARDVFRDAFRLVQSHSALEPSRFTSLIGLIEADIPLKRRQEAQKYMGELNNYHFNPQEQERFLKAKQELEKMTSPNPGKTILLSAI